MKIKGKNWGEILSIIFGLLVIILFVIPVIADGSESPLEEDTEAVSESDSVLSSGEPVLEAGGDAGISLIIPDNDIYSGTMRYKIPIEVPPGRMGVSPNLVLVYNSSQRNGWLGVGWSLDVGSIQRSTRKGVNYSKNKYVFSLNGSTSELVQRTEWGTDYYGAKIEGDFAKFYFKSSTNGWEVTTKDGTKYYYGTTSASRQDNEY